MTISNRFRYRNIRIFTARRMHITRAASLNPYMRLWQIRRALG